MKAKNFKCCCTIFLCVCLFLFLFFNFVELKNDNIIASANPKNVIVEEESKIKQSCNILTFSLVYIIEGYMRIIN